MSLPPKNARLIIMIYLLPLFFILEIIFLLLLSKATLQALTNLIHKIVRSYPATINILAILFLPGTIIHELSHMLAAGMTGVHTGDIELMPEIRENGVKLGSAEIGHSDPFRRSLIGLAPIILGLSIIITTLIFFGNALDFTSPNFALWKALLLLYVLFEISNTMFSSEKDMEGVLGFTVAIVAVLALILGVGFWLGWLSGESLLTLLKTIYTPSVSSFFIKANFALAVPIIINLSLIGLMNIRFRKRV